MKKGGFSMTLRRWMILSVVLMILGFLPVLLGQMTDLLEAKVIGGVLLAAGLVIWIFMIRCPECGARLDRFPGEYCKHCGNRLDWNKPPRF